MTSAVSRKPKPLRAIFFDAGNTLLEINYAQIRACLLSLGHEVPVEAVRRAECLARVRLDPHLAPGSSTEDGSIFRLYFTYLLEGLGILNGETAARFTEALRGYNRPVGLWNVAHPDASSILEETAHRGLTLGVISNSNGSVRGILEDLGLARYLRVVLDSAVVGAEKPNPKIFRVALAETGVEAHEAVYIGDLYSVDVLGARGVGLPAILLDPIGAWGDVDCPKARSLREAVRLAIGES